MLPVTPTFRLDGRRAFIVGASRGIGLASAAALSEAGAEVFVAARSTSELDSFCAELRAAGRLATAVALDVTDSRAVDAAFVDFGPFEIVVHSVGINRPVELVDLHDADLDDMIAVNVRSAFVVARAATRGMKELGGGSIILISSQMGHVGSPRRTVYSATKHALEGLAKSLAWEVGMNNVRVNTICPTFIETEMTKHMLGSPGFRKWVSERNALGRVGTVEEVMGAVVFLAGDASSLMTGSSLMLDAGWTAQ
ncbi:SDR family NAD(P)-dependent oxidoreductase [Subtercola boreus]|uniref:3-oxoacyl-ACP reductase n=1 Tax=Subtercola boreus TaxID=120213 RepID=A0A3E0WD53_9MICO|nr:SDR family oxidoreductase [Subtercola boreus]RFA22740.1 3-oxoacyl-ACP reductase [Subtercola boreus]RFA23095.1 3-oxoacyl-ACP reductase [Subtercola boreus]RFA28848.1 3-oxoacyl-ACP reductase [Subtercola boreus]